MRRSPGAWIVICSGMLMVVLSGCGNDVFPNAPQHSFLNTSALGPGPGQPLHPIVGHTIGNPPTPPPQVIQD